MNIITLVIVFAIALAVAVLLWPRGLPQPTQAPDSLQVTYTHHAKQRMQQRGITANEIEKVLAAPSRIVTDETNGSVRLECELNGRVVKAWVVAPWPATERAIIKTVAGTIRKTIPVPPALIGRVIGRQGATINEIQARTGARVQVARLDNLIHVSADNPRSVKAAVDELTRITQHRSARAA